MWSATRSICFISTATLALLCSIAAHGAGSATSYAGARKAFQEAYARVSANIPETAADDSEGLKTYPLYPYLVAARIQQALSGNAASLAGADKQAADFIAAYGQVPVSRGLRRAWLDSLARR